MNSNHVSFPAFTLYRKYTSH